MTEAHIRRCKEQAVAVQEAVRGQAEAAAFIERERLERLARMTPEEAHAIFDDLCRLLPTPQADESLQAWRLTTLLTVREAMARLSQNRRHE